MWGAFWEIEDEVKVQERGESVTINVQNHTITQLLLNVIEILMTIGVSVFNFCFLPCYISNLYIYILCRLKGIIIFKLISNLLAQPSDSVMRSCYMWCAVLRGLWKQSPLLVKLWQGF